jgi:hypothetical protein
MNTDRLIDALTSELTPEAPLNPPWMRATGWTLGALVFVAAVTLLMASPAQVVANGRDWPFLFYQCLAALTGASAAAAAFASTVPGHSSRSVRVAVIAALFWFGSLSIGAAHEWSRGGVDLAAPGELACSAMIVLGSAVPAAGLALMLRRGAPLTPRPTAAMGALAAASFTSIGACLSQPHPSDMLTAVWHGTAILLLVALAALGGNAILRWNTRR